MATAVEARAPEFTRRIPLIPAVALGVFAALALAVQVPGPVVALDHRVAGWVAVHRSVTGMRVAHLALNLGQPTAAPLALLALAALLGLRRRSWEPVAIAAVSVTALSLVVLVTKNSIGRIGPGGSLGPVYHGTFGQLLSLLDRGAFPSGHTTTAVVTWTVGAALVRGRLDRWGLALVTAVGLVVGAGLVYAGFHWFSDVLGAYPVGIALSWALLRIPRPVAVRANRTDRHVRGVLGARPVTTRSQAGA